MIFCFDLGVTMTPIHEIETTKTANEKRKKVLFSLVFSRPFHCYERDWSC